MRLTPIDSCVDLPGANAGRRTTAVAASPSGPSMEPFPLVIPIQIGVQSLDEPRERELVMRTRIPAAGEGPGVPCLHPDQRTDLLIAFGFTLAA